MLDNEGQSFDAGDIGEIVIVPISTARVSLIRTASPRSVQYVVAQSKSAESVNDMVVDIKELLRDRHRIRADDEDDFRVVNFGEFAKSGRQSQPVCRWRWVSSARSRWWWVASAS